MPLTTLDDIHERGERSMQQLMEAQAEAQHKGLIRQKKARA